MGDAARRGFVGKVHVARANQAFNASIGRANAQLRDELIDFTRTPPAPYVNLVQTPAHPAPLDPNPVNADGTFINPGVINYSISATPPHDPVEGNGYYFESANGSPNSRYPGLPGWNDATYAVAENINAFAWEELAWIEADPVEKPRPVKWRALFGYRQTWAALDALSSGKPDALDELPQRGAAATRQLAKRQLTALRGVQGRTVIAADAPDMLARLTERIAARWDRPGSGAAAT